MLPLVLRPPRLLPPLWLSAPALYHKPPSLLERAPRGPIIYSGARLLVAFSGPALIPWEPEGRAEPGVEARGRRNLTVPPSLEVGRCPAKIETVA